MSKENAKKKKQRTMREIECIRNQIQETGENIIDEFISRTPEQKLNLFNAGIFINLKSLKKITLKKVLKMIIKGGKGEKKIH